MALVSPPHSTLKCNTSGGGDRFSGRMMLHFRVEWGGLEAINLVGGHGKGAIQPFGHMFHIVC